VGLERERRDGGVLNRPFVLFCFWGGGDARMSGGGNSNFAQHGQKQSLKEFVTA